MPESELPPVPEDDDLNATVIEVMTDVEVLLAGSSVIDVFAVNSARRKRVEVSERKLTESDRKLFRKAKELEFQSWLDHRVFDLVKKKFVDQERVMRARWVLTWKSTGKAKSTFVRVGLSGSRSDRGSPWQSHVVSCIRGFDHAMGGLAQVSPDLRRHQDSIPDWR